MSLCQIPSFLTPFRSRQIQCPSPLKSVSEFLFRSSLRSSNRKSQSKFRFRSMSNRKLSGRNSVEIHGRSFSNVFRREGIPDSAPLPAEYTFNNDLPWISDLFYLGFQSEKLRFNQALNFCLFFQFPPQYPRFLFSSRSDP